MLSISSLAILLGFFFTLDLFQAPKKGAYFVRNLSALLVASIPAIINSLGEVDSEFLALWQQYFFCIFSLSLIVFVFGIYRFIFVPNITNAFRHDIIDKGKFTFLYFLQEGNRNFQKELDREIDDAINNSIKVTSSVFKAIERSLPKFMFDINLTLADKDQKNVLIDYAYYVLQSFISNFICFNDARFTIREYDPSSHSMITVLCTRDGDTPSPIPLNVNNLISFSMETGRPEIYSRNKEKHFETKRSIMNKSYDDYVTYCILSENGKPLLSVNMDVKGRLATERMKVLVDNSIFTIICDTIRIKNYLDTGGNK